MNPTGFLGGDVWWVAWRGGGDVEGFEISFFSGCGRLGGFGDMTFSGVVFGVAGF